MWCHTNTRACGKTLVWCGDPLNNAVIFFWVFLINDPSLILLWILFININKKKYFFVIVCVCVCACPTLLYFQPCFIACVFVTFVCPTLFLAQILCVCVRMPCHTMFHSMCVCVCVLVLFVLLLHSYKKFMLSYNSWLLHSYCNTSPTQHPNFCLSSSLPLL